MIYLTPQLKALLEEQRRKTLALQHQTGQILPWYSTTTGSPSSITTGHGTGLAGSLGFPVRSPTTLGGPLSETWYGQVFPSV